MLVPGLVSATFRPLTPGEVVRRAAMSGLMLIEWGGDVHVPAGDLAAARQVRRLCDEAGVQIACYGSYYRAGELNEASFEAVLMTASELGAPRIRVWAGTAGSDRASSADRARVAADLRRVGEAAGSHGMAVVIEYHGNSLTDSADSALGLMSEVSLAQVRLGWQPNVHIPVPERLADLRRVAHYVEMAHVFHWSTAAGHTARLSLSAGASDWQQYLEVLRAIPGTVPLMLEFLPGDDPDELQVESRTLRSWLESSGAAA